MVYDRSDNGRLGRQEYFMKVATVVAERSTCARAKVGAVLVDVEHNKIVATGYNGSVRGGRHCIDTGCLMHRKHCIRTIHAELNAVLHLERPYNVLTLYCTHQPCLACLKALITARVRYIYYSIPYKDIARDRFLKDLGNVVGFTHVNIQ